MLRYVAANLEPPPTGLKAAMSNTHFARHRVSAGTAILYVALGWHVVNVNGMEIIWPGHDSPTPVTGSNVKDPAGDGPAPD
jgi:hypothetical protein